MLDMIRAPFPRRQKSISLLNCLCASAVLNFLCHQSYSVTVLVRPDVDCERLPTIEGARVVLEVLRRSILIGS